MGNPKVMKVFQAVQQNPALMQQMMGLAGSMFGGKK
jgi:hypothetical protein